MAVSFKSSLDAYIPACGSSNQLWKQNADLYRAQAAASNVFKGQLFPSYSSQYINAQAGFKGKVLWCYSKAYNAAAFVNQGLKLVISAVQYVASSVLKVGDYALGWAVNPVINTVYPINPINGQRHFVGLSRSVEKVLGDWVFYPLATLGMRQTHQLLSGTRETIASKVNTVVQNLVQANRELVNPSNKTTKFNYRVTTVASSQVNAFAVPAGGMVVFTQIVKEIQGAIESKRFKDTTVKFADGSTAKVDLTSVTLEDVLSALLGHEMTHSASRHGIAHMAGSLIRSVVLSIGRFVLIAYLKNSDPEYQRLVRKPSSERSAEEQVALERKEASYDGLNKFFGWIEEKTKQLSGLFNSRKNEYEADVTGAYFGKQAGYNPLGALYLQAVLADGDNSFSDFFHKNFEFAYTHPYGENRKRALFAAINEMASEALQGRTTWNIVDNGYDLKASSPAFVYAANQIPVR